MFDLDEFLDQCRHARDESEPRVAVRDVVRRAVADPSSVAATFNPERAGINLVHQADDLTVLHVVWAPGMSIYPHDHRMWAIIGIYEGAEDNAFYRREAPGAPALTESGGKRLLGGDVLVLGDDTIHGVTNPLDHLTGAIHVYGGDLVAQPRSQWGPGDRVERPYDFAEANQQFADANAAWLGVS
jgi:predicted metal-dependent enzyme (double-stranded beta helix superfamily)